MSAVRSIVELQLIVIESEVKPNEFVTLKAGLVKLPASRKTQESKAPSVPSAIANLM